MFDLDEGSSSKEPCVFAIGIFDALHRGHAKLLTEAKKLAHGLNAKFFAMTFYPHPDTVLRGASSKFIYPLEIRARLLLDFGADKVFLKNFDRQFASESPERFMDFLRDHFPNMRGIVTGENFRFGKNAAADALWLEEHSKQYGIQVRAVEGLKENGEFISSTRLRRALSDGRMEDFKYLDGRPYFAQGVVSEGKKLGRTLGFPTLNIFWDQECRPPFGAYAARLYNLNTAKIYDGVASYGTNPTVGVSAPVVETNLFEDINFGVGTEIKVELLKFLRPQEHFSSIDALKKQIALDKNEARGFFKRS